MIIFNKNIIMASSPCSLHDLFNVHNNQCINYDYYAITYNDIIIAMKTRDGPACMMGTRLHAMSTLRAAMELCMRWWSI